MDGRKGFGIQPWRRDDLLDLLGARTKQGLPTIINATDPYGLVPEIGELIDLHFHRGDHRGGGVRVGSSTRPMQTKRN